MDMPEKIAAWRFHPKKADAWIKGGWSEVHDRKTTEYTRSDLAVEVKPLVFNDRGAEWWACSPFGIYVVAYVHEKDGWAAWEPDGDTEDPDDAKALFPDERAAMSYVQLLYEKNVLSALTTRPDDLRPKLQALVTKWEGMTCRTKCAQELREVLEGAP